jgi:hypothetical protein
MQAVFCRGEGKMTKTRTDCVEQIVSYITNLNQIVKCAKDSLIECDVATAIDCTHKFYTAYGAVSAAIIMFNGVLDENEILKYHSTLYNISKEFKEDSIKLAKKCTSFPK